MGVTAQGGSKMGVAMPYELNGGGTLFAQVAVLPGWACYERADWMRRRAAVQLASLSSGVRW